MASNPCALDMPPIIAPYLAPSGCCATALVGAGGPATQAEVGYLNGNDCGATLDVGANCKVSVTFKPASTGTATGTLSISGDPSSAPQVVALQGTSQGSKADSPPPTSSSKPDPSQR